MAATNSERQLYGGAITCSIPRNYADISNLRQVPDHQEVWQEQTEGGGLLVVEILDLQTAVSNNNAAEFFFNDLAEHNGVSSPNDLKFSKMEDSSSSSSLLRLEGLPPDSVCLFGRGAQKVVQGNEFDAYGNRRTVPEAQWVSVELGLIRLPSVETDLLVTLTSPAASNPQETVSTSSLFQSVFASLRIRDWGLFGH